jgi:hypothetical protein
MKNTKRLLTLLVLIMGLGWMASAQHSESVLWFDFDTKNIPEPKERKVLLAESFVNSHMSERWKRATDVPRWVRLAVGVPKPAANVNALDEVPDSSWYTNRHALRPMTTEQLVRGPNRGAPPDFTGATIINVKKEGVTPGLQLKARNGDKYLIKFDSKDYPELQSGAEVISTKILYAAGYNVPENYIGVIDPRSLDIEKDVPLTQEDLAKLLQKAAQRPDGTYRVLASKMLSGEAKGPFAFVGLRADDPNDLIPHEHRRELRGLRVIASWINHWDMKEQNTLDMYVEEGGRKFLRHYLIDFGSSLGGGKSPLEYFHGREYMFDTGSIMKEVVTLGFHTTPDEKSVPLVMPEVGIFSASDVEPGDWVPTFRTMPFDNMTDDDAMWATRVLLSFSEDDILQIVKTAQYSNPKATEYMHRTLLARRQIIASHWLKDRNPVAKFALETGADGVTLKFHDLISSHDLGAKAEYEYEMTNANGRSERVATVANRIPLGRNFSGETQIRIWTNRGGRTSKPIAVYVQNRPGGGYGIFRIERSS